MKSGTKTNGITFAVSDVTRATSLLPEQPYAQILAKALEDTSTQALESYSYNTKTLVSAKGEFAHGFIHAVNLAYDEHRPLVLSPDMIWLLIAQGVALHINNNSEALRRRFVSHEGKAEIIVIRDEFVRGFIGNDWEGVFAEFGEQIRAHVGDSAHGRIVRQFSTTGIVEQAAFNITLMDALQAYFDPGLLTMCGIPEITLEGITEDWEIIRTATEALAEYELDWWVAYLLPVLDQFVAASQGNVDLQFWCNFYKVEHQSGGPYITGHIVNLFPYLVFGLLPKSEVERTREYLQTKRGLSPEEAQVEIEKMPGSRREIYRNRYLGWQKPEVDLPRLEGIIAAFIPSPFSVAPFIWNYLGTKLPMEFVAGFVGVGQDTETLAVRPEIGWAVRYCQATV